MDTWAIRLYFHRVPTIISTVQNPCPDGPNGKSKKRERGEDGDPVVKALIAPALKGPSERLTFWMLKKQPFTASYNREKVQINAEYSQNREKFDIQIQKLK